MLKTEISFSESEKEVISGIDLQNGLSAIFFGEYGTGFRLVEVKFRFPYPLEKNETADVFVKHVRDIRVAGAMLKIFAARMIGRDSKKTVLYGTFTTVPN